MKAHSAEVHQLLHGYTDGHGQLGGSVKLSRADARTTLVLSDSSVSGAKVPTRGYLTGYPLVESGYYALSRTWMAIELPRPGCVWTHTLLIDFSDLATLSALSSLLSLFRRPKHSEFLSYQSSLLFADVRTRPPLEHLEVRRTAEWLRALYEQPEISVIATREEGLDVDEMAMSIWEQQWPRLRRSFRFCTLTVADRSTESARFDLQLLPEAVSFVKSRFRTSIEAGLYTSDSAPWSEDAVFDLSHPDSRGLRTFLRQAGGESGLGRGSFKALCIVHSAVVMVKEKRGEANAALETLLGELTNNDLQVLAPVVVDLAIENMEVLNLNNGLWLLSHLDDVDESTFVHVLPSLAKLAVDTWLAPKVIAGFVRESIDFLSMRQRRVLEAINVGYLIDKILKSPNEVQTSLILLRPELIMVPELWERAGKEQDFLWRAALAVVDPSLLLEMLIPLHNEEMPRSATATFGVTRSLMALSSSCLKGLSTSEQRRPWLIESMQTVGAVAQAFTDGPTWDRQLLVEISRLVAPEAIPNEVGSDPWLAAYGRSNGRVGEIDELFISSYLLNRALSGASKNPHQLVCMTLQLVYKRAADNSLTEEAWRVLEYRLPWSYFWYDWDRCKRLRDAVADLYMKQGIPAAAIFEITDDLVIFEHVVKGIREKKKGRRYLEQTLLESPHSKAKSFPRKVVLVEELL